MEHRFPQNIKWSRLFAALLAALIIPLVVGIFGHRMTNWEKGYVQGLADAESRQFIRSMPGHPDTRFSDMKRYEFYLSWNKDPVLGCRFQPPLTSWPRDTEWIARGWQRLSDEKFKWYQGYETAVASVRRTSYPVHAEILFTSADQWKQLFESGGQLIDSKPGNDGGGLFRVRRDSHGINISSGEAYEIGFSEPREVRLLDQRLSTQYVILKIENESPDRPSFDHPTLYIFDQQGRLIAHIDRRLREIERPIRPKSHNDKDC